MIVHWLIKKDKKVVWQAKENIESFCKANCLDFHWAKSPRSHFCIDDIKENSTVLINSFIEHEFGIQGYKTTTRSNQVLARKKIEGLIYYEDIGPIYNLQSKEEKEKKIALINNRYSTNYKLDEFE